MGLPPRHRSRAVREYLSQGAARRIRRERLPGFAPELNPDEGGWRGLKRVDLRNALCAGLAELQEAFAAATAWLRGKPVAPQAGTRVAGYV